MSDTTTQPKKKKREMLTSFSIIFILLAIVAIITIIVGNITPDVKGATLGDFHAGNLAEASGDEAAREELRDAVLRRLAALRTVDRETVELHYGLADGIPRTLKEIAALRGVSTTMVHKVLHRALAALRPPAPAA